MQSTMRRARSKQDEFITKENIGKGSFGEVEKCQHKESSKIYAVKTIQISELYLDSIEEEASNMVKAQSEYVIDLVDSFYDTDIGSYILITPYYKHGSFDNFINQNWSFDQLLLFFYEMAKGLFDLFKNQILHLDLKPENILVKGPGQYVLCDLGCSRKMEGNMTASKSYNVLKVSCNTKGGGTPDYSSPDMILDGQMTQFSDIWSLGVILYKAIFKNHPLYKISKANLNINMNNFYEGKYQIKYNYESNPKFNPIIKIIERMLVCSRDKEKRTSWAELLQKILQLIKWPLDKANYVVTDFDNLLLWTDKTFVLTSAVMYYSKQIEKIVKANHFDTRPIIKNICIYLVTVTKELMRHARNITSEDNHFYLFETTKINLTKKQTAFAERLNEQVEEMARANGISIEIGVLQICRDRVVTDIQRLQKFLKGLRKPDHIIEKIHLNKLIKICEYICNCNELKYENRYDLYEYVKQLINS